MDTFNKLSKIHRKVVGLANINQYIFLIEKIEDEVEIIIIIIIIGWSALGLTRHVSTTLVVIVYDRRDLFFWKTYIVFYLINVCQSWSALRFTPMRWLLEV